MTQESMRAIRAVNGSLEFVSVPVPDTERNQVLVRVAAFGINRTDLLQVHLQAFDSKIPGVEFSGTVVKVGEGVEGFEVADKVCGFVYESGYSKFVVCQSSHMFHVPAHLSMIEAASLPMSWFTARDALSYGAHFVKRDKVLIHVGEHIDIAIALVHYAQIIGCRRVIVVCADGHDASYFRQNGKLVGALPDEVFVIDASASSWARVVKRIDPLGVQCVIDLSNGPFEQAVDVMSLGGSIVYMAPILDDIEGDLAMALNRHIRFGCTNIRARSPDHIAELCSFFKDRVADRFANTRLKPQVAKTFDWRNIREAHRQTRQSQGKVVCVVTDV